MPMRSISSKLILAFLSIGVVSVLIIAATAVWSTRAEFISFLSDQSKYDVVSRLEEYHRTYGSWERVESSFVYGNDTQQPGMGPGPHMKRQPFVLANANRRVI